MATIRIDANLEWRVHRGATGVFIGVCDAMGLAVEGDDQLELESVIAETLHFVFLDLLEDDLLERFLHDRGWRVASGVLRKPTPEDALRFDVPFRLVPAHAA